MSAVTMSMSRSMLGVSVRDPSTTNSKVWFLFGEQGLLFPEVENGASHDAVR